MKLLDPSITLLLGVHQRIIFLLFFFIADFGLSLVVKKKTEVATSHRPFVAQVSFMSVGGTLVW